MSESVTLKSYFYEVLIPSSQKNTSSPIEDILHHVSISFMKKLALYKCFNPRTHMGCDALVYRPVKLIVLVSIHAPTRGATNTFQSRVHICVVSIHAPTRGATLLVCPANIDRKFQSTHPHGVRRRGVRADEHRALVSIHAPTRGATTPYRYIYRYGNVSIHAPTRGATLTVLQVSGEVLFQSTHPHGVRLFLPGYPLIVRVVSIHAPTRGATRLDFPP